MNLETTIEQIREQVTTTPKTTIKSHHRESRMVYIGGVLFFILGFVVFLTSPMWMPTDPPVHSPLGQEHIFTTESTMTLKRWDYDKAQNVMEVEFKKSNDYVTEEYSYFVTAKDEQNRQVDVRVMYNSDNLMVLQLDDVNHATQVSLTVDLLVGQSDVVTYTSTFFCDPTLAQTAELSKEPKSDLAYVKGSIQSDIAIHELQIKELQATIEEIDADLVAYEDRIEAIEQGLSLLTGTEKTEAENRITLYSQEVHGLEGDKTILLQNIADIQEQNTLLTAQMNEIEG